MDAFGTWPVIPALLAALAAAAAINRRCGAPPEPRRFAAIDGLRGYLAVCVFLSHACIWYYYLRSGRWTLPPSHLYTHFGQTSVSLFFMITGLLFYSKLIDGRTKGIDFGRLFVSRVLRLVPLYAFAMCLLFAVVGVLSGGELRESGSQILTNAARWLGFTIAGEPDLNGVAATSTILAGVTWSLVYEWFFYGSLPVLALTLRISPPTHYLLASVAAIIGLCAWHPHPYHLLPFLAGILAALLVRKDAVCRFAQRREAGLLVLGCLGLTVWAYPSAYALGPQLLLTVAFLLIAAGNTLFGLLIQPVSRTLGEMAYSIYLLHGMLLFVLFTFLLGRETAQDLSATAHGLLTIAVTPVLIAGSYVTYRLIERPPMERTNAVTAWLRGRLTQRPSAEQVFDAPRAG